MQSGVRPLVFECFRCAYELIVGVEPVAVEVCSEHLSDQEEHRVADRQTVHREDSQR